MDGTAIARRLVRATEAHRLLDHPFYRAWADGTLTLADLGFYSTQYWRQVEAFPGYLDSLAERLPEASTARRIVADNLADERDDDHPGLWLRFAEAVGASREHVVASDVEPETRRCVASFSEATTDCSPFFALGMLFGYESQTPEVAATKVDGLRDHFGIDGDPVEYFALHGELDVEHTAGLATAISDLDPTENDLRDAESGAAAGAAAVYGLLDGVARVRSIG